jgi:hypothetical protein
MTVKKKDIYIKLPAELIREIDALAGPRKRSAFLAEAVARRLGRLDLLSVPENSQPLHLDRNLDTVRSPSKIKP